MDVGIDESQWQDYQPDLLFLGLRCPVCLDFYEKPHTLNCGHTFCLRCLRTLAKMARRSTSRSPIDRLRFRCPSCRKMTVARPILRRHAAVNIALRDVVDAWFSSPYSVGKLESISLRSLASQTEDTTSIDNLKDNTTKTIPDDSIGNKVSSTITVDINATKPTVIDDSEGKVENDDAKCSTNSDAEDDGIDDVANDNEGDDDDDDDDADDNVDDTPCQTTVLDIIDDDISREEIRHVTVHRFPVKRNKKQDLNIDIVSTSKREEVATDTNDSLTQSDITFETSSSEEDSDMEIVPLLGDVQLLQDAPRRHIFAIRSFVTVLKLMFTEISAVFRGIWHSRCRLGLTIFWFAYGGLIISLSRGFLPWMVLYTIVYLLIMYAEMARPFMVRY